MFYVIVVVASSIFLQNFQIPEYTVRNPIPLSQLNLDVLDTETRLILEEKEQALLASMETVQIQQV